MMNYKNIIQFLIAAPMISFANNVIVDFDFDNNLDEVVILDENINFRLSSRNYTDNLIPIVKTSDNDRISVYNINNIIYLINSFSSNPSFNAIYLSYDKENDSIINNRIESVTFCGSCQDTSILYCSYQKNEAILEINLNQDLDNKNTKCFISYQDKEKTEKFNTLNDLLLALENNYQFLLTFNCNDVGDILKKYPKNLNKNKKLYNRTIDLFRKTGNPSVAKCLEDNIYIGDYIKKGVINKKAYLYNEKLISTKKYLINQDKIIILNEKIDQTDQKW